MKAIIPAAGLGTRFLPGTKAVPKELLLVLNKPVIQYIVEEALAASCDEVVIVSSHDKNAIESHFAPAPDMMRTLRNRNKNTLADEIERVGNLSVSFVYQEEPLGLGHAVHCAAEKAGAEDFFVLLGDTIAPENDILPKMLEVSSEYGNASVLTVFPVRPDEVCRFGIVNGYEVAEGVLKVSSVIEKPQVDEAPTNMAIFGRYLLSARVMKLLATTGPGIGGEIQLTDAILALISEEPVYALVIDRDKVFDTGTVEDWIATNVAMLSHQKGGVC